MTTRLRIVFGLIAIAFLVIVLRLFYWQVIKADELNLLGKAQYGKSIKIEPIRGEIKTSDGFPIASNKISYLLYANPKQIENITTTSQILSGILGKDEASISAQLRLENLFWVPLDRGLDNDIREVIEKEKIPGIGFEQEYERYYPEASMAANLLGFVGKDELGNSKGYFGLEGYYDRLLRGKEGSAVQIRDAFGRPILARVDSKNSFGTDGNSLELNINRSIQYIVENELKEGVEQFGASGGMIGIIEPGTGNVIAMASFPSFDPKLYEKYTDTEYKNPFISNLYEPGSTFKPLVMSAAFNEKLLKPTTKCPICGGPVSVGGYDLKTWNGKYLANSTMIEVIQNSDNTGMVFTAQTLGLDNMLKYLNKFGIGKITGIDLEGETAPEIKPKKDWYEVDLATTGFGQGISITPIELLMAFASIANKGVMMEPHVVKSVIDLDGKVTRIEPKEIGRPISSSTAKIMTELLVNAVENGEAKRAKLDGYKFAGKTGTASIPIEGEYDPEQTIASFIGFAPANDPKFVMIVIFDRPTNAIYGSETAAPIFFSIAKDLLKYYGIAPDE